MEFAPPEGPGPGAPGAPGALALAGLPPGNASGAPALPDGPPLGNASAAPPLDDRVVFTRETASAEGRRLQGTVTLDVSVTLILPPELVSEATAIESAASAISSDPTALSRAFEEALLTTCTSPINCAPPTAMSATPAVQTQVYMSSEMGSTTTTTTLEPIWNITEIATVDTSEFIVGLGLGFTMGSVFLVCGGACLFFAILRKKQEVNTKDQLAPGEVPKPRLVAWSTAQIQDDEEDDDVAPPVPIPRHLQQLQAALPAPPARPGPPLGEAPAISVEDEDVSPISPASPSQGSQRSQRSSPRHSWRGGGAYEGQVSELGLRHGEGRMEWPSGKVYVGQWQNDKFHGHGLLVASDDRGCLYNGQFRDGACHGIGRCEWSARGTWYDGEWAKGLQSGLGETGSMRRRVAGTGRNGIASSHIGRMEKGEKQENMCASHVIMSRYGTVTVELQLTAVEVAERLASSSAGEEEVQVTDAAWGIATGNPNLWLSSRWGQLLLTRILEGGPLDRWAQAQRASLGDMAQVVLPNALILRVNGVEGSAARMLAEIRKPNRDRLVLEVQNPPCVCFENLWDRLRRRGNQQGSPAGRQPASWRPWLEGGADTASASRSARSSVPPGVPPKPPGPPPRATIPASRSRPRADVLLPPPPLHAAVAAASVPRMPTAVPPRPPGSGTGADLPGGIPAVVPPVPPEPGSAAAGMPGGIPPVPPVPPDPGGTRAAGAAALPLPTLTPPLPPEPDGAAPAAQLPRPQSFVSRAPASIVDEWMPASRRDPPLPPPPPPKSRPPPRSTLDPAAGNTSEGRCISFSS